MGSISRFVPALVLLCLAGRAVLSAQSATPPGIPSGNELRAIEQTLARPGITAAARREALTRLARLRQLAGDLAGAATSWLDAERAEPGQSGDALNTAGDAALAAGAWFAEEGR